MAYQQDIIAKNYVDSNGNKLVIQVKKNTIYFYSIFIYIYKLVKNKYIKKIFSILYTICTLAWITQLRPGF